MLSNEQVSEFRGAGYLRGRRVLSDPEVEELRDELEGSPDDLQTYVKRELNRIMRLATFEYGVEGALTGPGARARADSVTIPLLRQLAA